MEILNFLLRLDQDDLDYIQASLTYSMSEKSQATASLGVSNEERQKISDMINEKSLTSDGFFEVQFSMRDVQVIRGGMQALYDFDGDEGLFALVGVEKEKCISLRRDFDRLVI